MGKITAIRDGRKRSERVNIFLDGKFAFGLAAEVVAKEGLRVGQELSAGEIETLTGADHFHRCQEAAFRYLSYRPRSESEVRTRLRQRGFEDSIVGRVVAGLKAKGLVDDGAFARFWQENRESFSPRSRRLTRLELRQKGVADEVIDRAVEPADDGESAYRAAMIKARSLSLADYQGFHRRLDGYLRRRGFGYEVINQTVKRVWQEMGGRFEDSVLP